MRIKRSVVAALVVVGMCGSGEWLLPADPGIKSAVLKPTPLVARTPEGERQVVFAEIDSTGLKACSIDRSPGRTLMASA